MEIYRDAVTGYEVRRYTDGPERNAKLYFTCENFSTDDKYFFFMKQRMQEGMKELSGGCYRADVETGADHQHPSFNRKGDRILFSNPDENGNAQVCVIDLNQVWKDW